MNQFTRVINLVLISTGLVLHGCSSGHEEAHCLPNPDGTPTDCSGAKANHATNGHSHGWGFYHWMPHFWGGGSRMGTNSGLSSNHGATATSHTSTSHGTTGHSSSVGHTGTSHGGFGGHASASS